MPPCRRLTLGCVKTHTSAKCGKYNSPSNRRAVCVQYDLALIICNAFEIFYARSERGRFYTAKTSKRHRPDRNSAVQKAAAVPLIVPVAQRALTRAMVEKSRQYVLTDRCKFGMFRFSDALSA